MLFAIDIVGYIAAFITNISLYPQTYKIYRISASREYEKLHTISLPTYLLNVLGCSLWLCYGTLVNAYPILFGSIMSIIPATYICFTLIYVRYFINISVTSPKNIIEIDISTDITQ